MDYCVIEPQDDPSGAANQVSSGPVATSAGVRVVPDYAERGPFVLDESGVIDDPGHGVDDLYRLVSEDASDGFHQPG